MVEGRRLRIVFFGTPEFAVPTLDALLTSRHTVAGVVTRPDRPRGRGQKTSEPPVKTRAGAAGVPVLQPVRLTDADFLGVLRGWGADLGVVAAYGKILTDDVLAMPPLGLVNVHASLLPLFRGAAPVHRAVINGEAKTGVTIMRVVKALDAGPMMARTERPISPEETSEEVERDLAVRGARLLVDTVDALVRGSVTEVPQDESASTYAPRLTKDDGRVQWTDPTGRIHNLIRGLYPWPHAFTYHHAKRLILLGSKTGSGVVSGPPRQGRGLRGPETETTPDPISGGPISAGTILQADGDHLIVATGDGSLAITQLQAEGRRPMTTREFLAGHRLAGGDRLTADP